MFQSIDIITETHFNLLQSFMTQFAYPWAMEFIFKSWKIVEHECSDFQGHMSGIQHIDLHYRPHSQRLVRRKMAQNRSVAIPALLLR